MKTPENTPPGIGTRLVRAGRKGAGRFVNPPVVHASTVLFDSVAEMHSGEAPYVYARRGTPTLDALSGALAELDGADGAVLCPSGLSAMTAAILPFVSAGDGILLPDSVYGPARSIADTVLRPFGVTTTYYDPAVGGGIADLIDERTRLVYVESPGSYTMEMQDLPAIAAAAHAAGVVVVADNTWATPLFCRPLDLGADIALLAATKYIGGHADLMMGAVTGRGEAFAKVRRHHGAMGLCAAPDDVYLALRGVRTLEVRLARHMASALEVAAWLKERPEVRRVLHPGLPADPGHALWQRDMIGSTGLFSIVLDGSSEAAGARFVDALKLFGIGYSWGGYESLAVPGEFTRTATNWSGGPLIRLHIGLEDPSDLIADLDQAFRLAAG